MTDEQPLVVLHAKVERMRDDWNLLLELNRDHPSLTPLARAGVEGRIQAINAILNLLADPDRTR